MNRFESRRFCQAGVAPGLANSPDLKRSGFFHVQTTGAPHGQAHIEKGRQGLQEIGHRNAGYVKRRF